MSVGRLRALFVTSECTPWVKTGGLGDVAAALPPALVERGVDVRVLMPAYADARDAARGAPAVARVAARGPFPDALLREARLPTGVNVYLIDCPPLYDRAGGPYQDEHGREHADNALRFAMLARVAASISMHEGPLDWRPDVLHCNDWQTGLAPAYLHFARRPHAATLMTVHNLAFQGVFDGNRCAALGLPESAFAVDGVEYYGGTSFLKAGLHYARALSTVSPTYAREIQHAPLGFGLEGLLAARHAVLTGILNGIDTRTWNPADDTLIEARYTAATLERKAANKRALQQRVGLPVDATLPLFGVVSRLTEQKGADLFAALVPALSRAPAQLVVQGRGDAGIERALHDVARTMPDTVAIAVEFDETLAHAIEAGADAFLMPSRFEPCGLNQMYSQRYGTPPVAHRTGGLADSITDATDATRADGTATGFLFDEVTLPSLEAAVARAITAFNDPPTWRGLQLAGMRRDFGWSASAARYAELYASLAGFNTSMR